LAAGIKLKIYFHREAGFGSLTAFMTLKDIVAAGQRLETRVLVKAVKLYLAKRLDVYWGTVKQI
jgi:hypothetical protein